MMPMARMCGILIGAQIVENAAPSVLNGIPMIFGDGIAMHALLPKG